MDYFGEKYESKDKENCCDRCGLDLSAFFNSRNTNQHKVQVDWQEQLAFILNIKK